jgi:hypothetical protein
VKCSAGGGNMFHPSVLMGTCGLSECMLLVSVVVGVF